MTPVLQSIVRPITGDCFAACVASIMDLPLWAVPNFMAENANADNTWSQAQWDAVVEFCKEHGFQAFWLDPDLPEDQEFIRVLVAGDYHYIITGKSSAYHDYCHNVVANRGHVVHDPSGPDRIGIIGEPILYIGIEKLIST